MQILDAKSGLSSNTAFNITQDDSGFIWIATPLGLDRFDGKSFKSYRADGLKGSLTSNTIRALAVDATNDIWVGTKGEGVFRFDRTTETFHQYKYDVDDDSSLSHNEVLSILEDSQGRLWVGTEDGLNLFDRSSNNFKRFTFSVNGEALRRSPVLNIYEDHHTNLWVGVWNGGLNLLIGQDNSELSQNFVYGLEKGVQLS